VVVPSAPVVISPAPLLIPEYPRVSVQAWSGEDQSTAVRISRQLQGTGMPVTVIDNVTVNVQSGNVSLKGAVETEADHRALLSAVERAGGVRAIYDQLRVRSM
jgi:osmotically-inducible protein OsmY